MAHYTSLTRMRDLIADNALLLPVLSRFGIALGFGDARVGDVCATSGVDVDTFLAVVNYMAGDDADWQSISLESMMRYLRSAHTFFSDYLLPRIRQRLIETVSTGRTTDITFAVIKFFDDYVAEVSAHMEHEERRVFTHVEALLAGRRDSQYSIVRFKSRHRPIADKLHEIQELFICHFTAEAARTDMLNTLLFDIITCRRDLLMHCDIEDHLFVPAVEALEDSMTDVDGEAVSLASADGTLDDNGDVMLTPRERDIIAAIAAGLSNKEIATRLFLSVHTVATHRRNICAKLNIHSASAITLYAVMHGIEPITAGK